MPPLYKITEKGGKSYRYLKDDASLVEYRKANQGKNYIVNRLKGLGELSEDEVTETLMDVNNRIINQIKIENEAEASKLFEQLMGDGASFRKLFLKEHGEESYYNAE